MLLAMSERQLQKRPADEDLERANKRHELEPPQHIYATGNARVHNGHVFNSCCHEHGNEERQAATNNPKEYLDTLFFAEVDYRHYQIDDAYDNTCDWIADNKSYIEWKRTGRGILGIAGKPGSGKSTLMKHIYRLLCREADASHIRISFFFHRRGADLQHSELGMYRSLLYQLLKQMPEVATEIADIVHSRNLRQKEDKSDHPKWQWSSSELRHLFASAVATAAKTRSLEIFIDALDEVSDVDPQLIAKEFIKINKKLLKSNARGSICLAYRHFPIIALKGDFTICLEECSGEALSLFVSTKLQEELEETYPGELEASTIVYLHDKITKRASGVFLWASLVIDLVVAKCKIGRCQEMAEAIDSLPSELHEVYRHILTQLGQRSETLHVIYWVLFTFMPLTLEGMHRIVFEADNSTRIAGCIKTRTPRSFAHVSRYIIDVTGGLVEIQKIHPGAKGAKDNVLQFIHQSVVDYLKDDGFKFFGIETYQAATEKAHEFLAWSCIDYAMRHEDNIAKWVYPYTYFFKHARKAEAHGIPQSYFVDKCEWPSTQSHKFLSGCAQGIAYPGDNGGNSTFLHLATYSGLDRTVQALLNRGVPVDGIDKNGNTALHMAAKFGRNSIIQRLCSAGASIDLANYSHETPLVLAVGKGMAATIRLLLDRGADINAVAGGYYGNALTAASTGGVLGIVELLLDRGADINACGGDTYGNALAAASYGGHIGLIKLLLDRGADINAQGGKYGNALIAASYNRQLEVLKLLLDRGADIEAQGGKYGNAIQAASYRGHIGLIKLLLDRGAYINAKGGEYGSALRAAVAGQQHQNSDDRRKRCRDIEKLLLARGAIDDRDPEELSEISEGEPMSLYP